MLCGCSWPNLETNPMLDLHAIIEDYAWREFKHNNSALSGVLVRKSDFSVVIPWEFFEFDHHTTKFNPRHNSVDGFVEKNVVNLYEVTFVNDSRSKQVYRLKCTRSTKAKTSISFQRGFMIDNKANFVLTVPKRFGDFGVKESFDGQFKIRECYCQTFEEDFNWTVDNDLIVDKHHATDAKMTVTEDELVADYEVKTTIRMLTSNTPLEIRKRGGKFKTYILLRSLYDVFYPYKGHNLNIIKVVDNQKVSRYDVEIVTLGIIRSTRWRDQKIAISSKSLKPNTVPKNNQSYTIPSLCDTLALGSNDVLTQVLKHATRSSNIDIAPIFSDSPKRGETLGNAVVKETKVLFPAVPHILSEASSEPQSLLETSVNLIEVDITPKTGETIHESSTTDSTIVAKDTDGECLSETSSLHKLFSLHAQSTVESDGCCSSNISDVVSRESISPSIGNTSLDQPSDTRGKRSAKLAKVTSV